MSIAADQATTAGVGPRRNVLVIDQPVRRQVAGAALFVTLCLALAGLTTVVTGNLQALVPFALALAPAAFAVILAWREGDGALGRLRRMLTLRPRDPRWYLVILLPIAWALGVVALAVALGESATGLFDTLTPVAIIIPLVVLLPAFAEEIAWRGYAVPRLLAVMSPLAASLVLAVPWTLLHLVLGLPGGVNAGAELWPTVLSLFAYSVILTWIFVGSGGSVLLTGLVHTGLNGVVPLMWGVDAELSWALRAILAAVIAVLVISLGGFRRKRRIA